MAITRTDIQTALIIALVVASSACGSDASKGEGGQNANGTGHGTGGSTTPTAGTGASSSNASGGTTGATGGTTPTATGGAGAADKDAAVGPDTPPDSGTPATGDHKDLGEGDGKDVVIIGDSYMNLAFGVGTQFSLAKISGRTYRQFSAPGTMVTNGVIPAQYDAAKKEDADIKTVIMSGGGNDVILDLAVNLPNCDGPTTAAELTPECVAALKKISDAAYVLIGTMADDGVQDVFYVGYGYPTTANSLKGTIEYQRAMQKERCDNNTSLGLRCHFVDPSQVLPTNLISLDTIHPTAEGYDVIGKMLWERMQAEGARR